MTLVSVCVASYNHQNYIETCLHSVLNQKTNFKFQIIIADDASTDNTQKLIKRVFSNTCIDHQLILRENNLGCPYNGLETFQKAKSKYIAILDGDDYWTDPYKLQKQVDYLEANPNCSICTHWVKTKVLNNKPIEENDVSGRNRPQIITSNDMFINRGKETLRGIHFMTLSVVAKCECFKFNNKILEKIPTVDNAIWINALEYGYAYCFPEFMGVYRRHQGGIYSLQHPAKNTLRHIVTLEYLKRYYPKYKERINILRKNSFNTLLDWEMPKDYSSVFLREFFSYS